MPKTPVSGQRDAQQRLLHCAVTRLRSTAWALAWALIVVVFGSVALVSFSSAEIVDSGAMLLFASASGVCVLALADVLLRLYHCGDLKLSLSPRLQRHISEQPFKPLPDHFVEQGAQPADAAVESWISSLTAGCGDVREYASRQREVYGFLRNADAVNLCLYAELRRRQRKAGCLAS